MNLLANITTDVPTAESLNIWVILASALIPYVLKKLFPTLPIPALPGPAKPAPAPQPVTPQPSLPGGIDPIALMWLLFKKFFPNLPDLQPGEPLTEAHFAALAKADLPSSVKPN